MSALKYKNKPVVLDGIWFPSKRQANRYAELMILKKAGLISELQLEKVFELRVNGMLVCKYRADFVYLDKDGRQVVEDTKGVRTRDYAIKAKLMIACHGLRVIEV